MGEERVCYFVGDFEALQDSGSVFNIRKIVYLGSRVNRAE